MSFQNQRVSTQSVFSVVPFISQLLMMKFMTNDVPHLLGLSNPRRLTLFPKDMKRKAEETLRPPYCWLTQGGLIMLDRIEREQPTRLPVIEEEILKGLEKVGGYATYDHLIYTAVPWIDVEESSQEVSYHISQLRKARLVDTS